MGKSFLPKKATRSSLDDGPISDLVGLKRASRWSQRRDQASLYSASVVIPTEILTFWIQSVEKTLVQNPSIVLKNALDTQRERIRSPLYFRIRTKNPLEIKVKSKLYSEPPWNNQRLWCTVQKSRLSYFSARLLCVLCAEPRRSVWTCVQRLDSPRPFRYYMGVERVLKLPQWGAKSKERKKMYFSPSHIFLRSTFSLFSGWIYYFLLVF